MTTLEHQLRASNVATAAAVVQHLYSLAPTERMSALHRAVTWCDRMCIHPDTPRWAARKWETTREILLGFGAGVLTVDFLVRP